jgi:hypothetical protein
MKEDGPFTPNLDSYFPPERDEPGGTPTWPLHNERNRSWSPGASPNLLLLGASLGLNAALLIALLSVLILGHTNLFAAIGSPAGFSGSPATGSAANSILSSPTAGSTTTPATGWLQLSSTSVQLGCDNGQQDQVVMLQNSGTEQVQWQAIFSTPGNAAGVEVGPNQGTLDPGSSMPIQIHNRTNPNDSQGGQQGTIQFSPTTPAAGPGPILSYTTTACG